MEEEQEENVEQAVRSDINVNPERSKRRFHGPQIQGDGKLSRTLKRLIVILIIVGVLIGGGWFILQEPDLENETGDSNSLSVPATPTSETIPTEKPSVEIDRSKVSIEVLNGTGIAGEASYLQGKLRDLDYTEIEIGNASNQDNEITVVTFSSDLSDAVVDEITQQLEDIYEDVNTKTSTSLDFDIEIITGLRKGQEFPTPTTKPAATPTNSQTPTPTGNTTPTQTPSPSPTPTP